MKRLLLAATVLVLGLATCGGSQGGPKGVSEIDIRAPLGHPTARPPNQPRIFSRRITDPAQVESIINWFNSLRQPGKGNLACAGGYATDVTFMFRSGKDPNWQAQTVHPAATNTCNPIHFSISGEPETFLVERRTEMPR